MRRWALLALLIPSAAGAQVFDVAARSPVAALSPLAATHRYRDSTAPRHREPLVAGILGFIPGLGHAYAAEPKRGVAVFGVWFVGGFAAFNSSNKFVSNTGAVLLLGTHAFSIADAARAARRFNRRHAR